MNVRKCIRNVYECIRMYLSQKPHAYVAKTTHIPVTPYAPTVAGMAWVVEFTTVL